MQRGYYFVRRPRLSNDYSLDSQRVVVLTILDQLDLDYYFSQDIAHIHMFKVYITLSIESDCCSLRIHDVTVGEEPDLILSYADPDFSQTLKTILSSYVD